MIQEAATKTIPVDMENSPEASGRVGLFTCSRKIESSSFRKIGKRRRTQT